MSIVTAREKICIFVMLFKAVFLISLYQFNTRNLLYFKKFETIGKDKQTLRHLPGVAENHHRRCKQYGRKYVANDVDK